MKSPNAVGLLVAILIVVALLVGAGVWLVRSVTNALEPKLSVGCTATVGAAGYHMAIEQARNAALIADISVQRGMPARAASIALATAMQESALRNIDYGDRDSVGLFQQRPSQDWGTVEQIMDPVYSANAFYNVLAQVPDYVNLPINDAAQIVQRSGFPEAYAQHEPLSRAFASALTGQTPGGLNCTLAAATIIGSPDAVTAGAQEAMGPLAVLVPSTAPSDAGTVMTFEVPEAHGWMLAHWALANANELGIVQISHAGQTWDRNDNQEGHNVGWQPSETGTGTQVMVTLAAPIA
ncbi:hypothetical protein ART_1893 [Arthrobacter sp. PAMC 25486]|uniref:hypothetical protein n=1 Tax=Arthrobacter sp. PAMC 25486 TaxID=1494608 RepID=UPI000535BC53|nr:hypothetical protein [Arthrobacter sp. PAMC 25486]AIY01492.1 hypothetical protein ART_1893 [Arthrobacter sp. PAMC 25486]